MSPNINLKNLVYPLANLMGVDGVPVLLYHSVRPNFNWIGNVDPAQFDRQMRWLANHFSNLSLSQLASHFDEHKPLPIKTVAICFDDGYTDFIDTAAPILNRYHLTATLFVVTSSNPRKKMHGPLLTSAQLKRLFKQHWDLQSHTHTHLDLTKLTKKQLDSELRSSISNFQKLLGRKPTMLAYPNGKFNNRVVQTTSRYFDFAWTTQPQLTTSNHQPLQLPRIGITRDISLDSFKLYTTKAIDWLYNLNRL